LPAAKGWEDVRAGHIREWIVSLLDTRSDGYANNQYRSVQQFFKWYAAEEEVPNPMAGMNPPVVPEQPVPVLRKEQLAALLKACSGETFVDRRDTAILYMLMDAGVRRAEIADMLVDEIDLDLRKPASGARAAGTALSRSGARPLSPSTST